MITFKEIPAYKAIAEIYKHKKTWEFLYNAIECSHEVIEEDGEIYFDDHFDKLYYINDKEYAWIAGYADKKICFFQLVKRPVKNSVELVIAQKRHNTQTKDWFNNILEYIKQLYPELRYMTTFPMNDKLKDHYKKFGFVDYKKELKLTIR